jgi:hypothetical protein
MISIYIPDITTEQVPYCRAHQKDIAVPPEVKTFFAFNETERRYTEWSKSLCAPDDYNKIYK